MHLSSLIDREMEAFRDPTQIRIVSRVAIDTKVMADEIELGRVFGNLFENARRYGRTHRNRHRQRAVSYARTGPWVIVSVRDHGPGVAPEKLKQLTTPFFRGDAARTAATGAGLGLAIVEKARAAHGRQLRAGQCAGRRAGRAHPPEEGAVMLNAVLTTRAPFNDTAAVGRPPS